MSVVVRCSGREGPPVFQVASCDTGTPCSRAGGSIDGVEERGRENFGCRFCQCFWSVFLLQDHLALCLFEQSSSVVSVKTPFSAVSELRHIFGH